MDYFLFIVRSAIADFTRNRGRTFLTSLGIMIGVAAVVLLTAFGLGLKKTIGDQFESLGTNQLVLFPGQVLSNGQFRNSAGGTGSIRFDEKDIETLKRLQSVQFAVPIANKSARLAVGGQTENSTLYMTTADIFPARNLKIAYGSLLTKEQNDKRSKVIVLGNKIAGNLFYDDPASAVDKQVKIDGQSYKVVGVLQSLGGGGFGGPDFDSFAYMPAKTGYAFNPDKKYSTVIIKSNPNMIVAQAKEQIKQSLLKRYKEDDFSIVELTEVQSAVNSIFGTLSLALTGISAISLIVGGIGIMNIMYVTVSERVKEIGIRRAIGARRIDILSLFIVESVFLSLFGGLLGLAVSQIIVLIIQQYFPAYIDLQSVLLALGVSSGIGVFFGVFPARKAAMLSPIEAIRYE